jgi:GNAT superfamily N-acetyltransferase
MSGGASAFTLRPPAPGDLGWVVHRHGVIYAAEYGWDWTFEGLVAQIVADFAKGFDPPHDRMWIAQGMDGAVLGAVVLTRGDRPGAGKLRLLYVERAARGLGLGAALVDACIAGAREAGYESLELWTNDILVSARRLYEAAGFTLTASQPHHSWGQNLVGQTWTLAL